MCRRSQILLAASVVVTAACSEQPFTVNLDQPLRVLAIQPSGESSDVRIDGKVRVTFSEAVEPGSVTKETIRLSTRGDDGGVTDVETEVTYDAASFTATVAPLAPLAYSTRHTVVVTTAIQRERAPEGSLPVEVRATFVTEHPPAFRIVGTHPGAGTNTAAIDAVLVTTFSEDVDPATVTAGSIRVVDADSGEAIPGALAVEGALVTFTPAAPLGYSRELEVTYSEAVASTRATPEGGHLEHDLTIRFGTLDPPTLRVLASLPGAGADDVRPDAVLGVIFSEPIDPASATAETVRFEDVTDPAAPVELLPEDAALRLTLSEADTRLTFDPAGELGFTRIVRVTLRGSADPAAPSLRSARATEDGGYLPADVVYEVKTLDPPALQIVSTVPGAGSVGAPIDTEVSVTFSEPIQDFTSDPATAPEHFRVEDVADPGSPATIAGGLSLSADGTTAIFTPAAPLAYDTEHRVTLSLRLRSLRATDEGGNLLIDVSYVFRTEPPPPLTLLAHVPSADAFDVPRRTPAGTPQPVLLTFSEDVDPATVAGSVALTTSGGAPVPGQATALGPTVTFEPAALLDYSAQYRVTVLPGIESTRGRTLGAPVSFVFDTRDPPALQLVSYLPSGGAGGVLRTQPLVLTFSEGIDQDDLAVPGAFEVYDVETGAAVAGTLRFGPEPADELLDLDLIGADSVVTFSPAPPDPLFPQVLWPYSRRFGLRIADTVGSDRATDGAENPTAHHGGQLVGGVDVEFRLIDPPPLLVTDRSPSADAQGVGRDQPLVITLSEGVAQSSVVLWDGTNDAAATVRVFDEVTGLPVPGALTFNAADAPGNAELIGADNVLTFTPAGGFWAYALDVGVQLSAAIRSDRATDYQGVRSGYLDAAPVWSFDVVEPPDLLIADRLPGPGTQVLRAQPIVLLLSEGVAQSSVILFDGSNAATATFTVLDADTNLPIPGTLTYNGADAPAGADLRGTDNQLTFTPAGGQWDYSQDVRVTLDAAIRSDRGLTYGGVRYGHLIDPTLTWAFHAEDPPELLVVLAIPGPLEANVSPNADVSVTFNQVLDTSTVSSATFIVEDITGGGATQLTGVHSFDASQSTAIFNPDADFPLASRIRVTLRGGFGIGICSALATSDRGCLSQDVSWVFDVVPVPILQVVATQPVDNSQNVPVTANVLVTWNLDVLQATIDPASNPGVVVIEDITNPGAPRAVTISLLNYDGGTFTAAYEVSDPLGNPGELDTSTPYRVQVRGGPTGPLTAQAGEMIADYLFDFVTGTSNLILGTKPPDLATGVDVEAPICAIFNANLVEASVTSTSFTLSFVDEFGRTVNVPPQAYDFNRVDPTTFAVLDPNPAAGTANEVCFVPDPAAFDCFTDLRTLLYNETYAATLTDQIQTSAGPLVGAYAWTFTTGAPPLIEAAFAANDVVTVDPLAGAGEVPVNAAFSIRFAAAMNPASITAASIELLRADTGALVPAAVALAADGRTAVLTPGANLLFRAALPEGYLLRASGGLTGATDLDGNYLEGDVTWAFTTSPATRLLVAAPVAGATGVSINTLVVAELDRAIHLPSLSPVTLNVTAGAAVVPGLTAVRNDLRAAVFIPSVELLGNTVHTIHVTTGLRDFRGNPMPGPAGGDAFSSSFTTSAGIDPTDPGLSASAPAAGGVLGSGHAPLRLTFSEAMNMASLVSTADPAASTVHLVDDLGARIAVVFTATTTTTIEARAVQFLRSGRTYTWTLDREVSDLARNPLNGAPISRTFTVEGVAPTVTAVSPAGGATGVPGEASVTVTFSERMDPASIHAGSFTLTCGGNPVAGTITTAADGLSATLDPLAALSAAASGCAVAVTATATDTAGNPLAPFASAFTVVTTPMAVTLTPADGSLLVPTAVVPVADFDRAVDLATVLPSRQGGPTGTVRLFAVASGLEQFGCLEADAADQTRINFRPVDPLQAGTAYRFLVDPLVSDLAGNGNPGAQADFTTAP